VIQVELFYEKGRPSWRYYRLPGEAYVHAMFDDHTPEPEPERFTGQLRRPDSSAYPDAAPDPAPTPLGTARDGRFERPASSACAETTFEQKGVE